MNRRHQQQQSSSGLAGSGRSLQGSAVGETDWAELLRILGPISFCYAYPSKCDGGVPMVGGGGGSGTGGGYQPPQGGGGRPVNQAGFSLSSLAPYLILAAGGGLVLSMIKNGKD